MTYLSTLTALAALTLATPSGAWVLEDCPPAQAAALAAHERDVRAARPGSPLYVPHAFPKDLPQWLANLEFSFREMWRSTPEPQVPAEDRRLLAALAEGKVQAVWQTAEDWTYARCGAPGRVGRSQVVVLVLFDGAGQPLGRFAQEASGHWAAAQFPDSSRAKGTEVSAEFGAAAEIARRWATRAGGVPTEAQWVVAHGTSRCDLVTPCLVFKARGETFIVQQGELFQLEVASPVLRTSDLLSNRPLTAATKALRHQVVPGRRHLVTVGFDRVVFAARVEP